MPIQMAEQLWLYNNWANNLLFKAYEGYGERMPASCLRLLSHIVNTQSHWLNRVRGEKQTVGVWDEHDLEGCKRLHEETAQEIKAVMEVHAAEMQVKIGYANTKGLVFQNTLSDILLHVFNHGTYHRAQIAQEMRESGLDPINTDYINFVR